jgi:hypothetical protein
VRVLRAFKDTDDDGFTTEAPDYRRLVEDPVMALDLDPAWRSLDDYVAALRSPYRREYRGARERAGYSSSHFPVTPAVQTSETVGVAIGTRLARRFRP